MNPSQTSGPRYFSALFILCATFSAIFLAAPASGAVVLWDASPVNIDTQNASQVSTVGTLFAAVDINSILSGLTYNINGVVFTSGTPSLSIGGSGYGNYGTAPGTQTTYSSIVNGIAYLLDSSSSLAPIQINNLTAGQTYQVQIFNGYSNNYTATTRYGSVAPTGPSYDHALNESPTVAEGYAPGSVFPQYILGTFVADLSGSQSIYYYGDASYGIVAAVQVRAVPEPSTVALAALGACTVFFRLRRRQRA